MNTFENDRKMEAAHRQLLEAATTVHTHLPWGVSTDDFAGLVVRATPETLGVVEVEIIAGTESMHAGALSVAAELPHLEPTRTLVLHLSAAPPAGVDVKLYVRALAVIASTSHVGRTCDGDPADSFADWLVQRNTMLEREVERMRDVARFLIETARLQLGES